MHIPYEFEHTDADTLIFKSFARSLTIRICNITDVDARRWNKGFIKIRSTQGSVSLFREMPGIHALINAVKDKNSMARIKGNY